MTEIKNTSPSFGEDVEGLIHCTWGYKMVPPPWKIVGQFLRKVGIHLSNDLAILLPTTNYTSIEGLVYQGL